MTTRNIVALAVALVAVGIALTLIFGRESEAAERAPNQSKENVLEPRSCFPHVSELFWRKRL
jgi:hypothetical protein